VRRQRFSGGSLQAQPTLRRFAATVLAFGLALAPAAARDVRAVATAADDTYAVDEDTSLIVDAPGILANDTDDGGAPLCVVDHDHDGMEGSVESWGTDGSFTYTPDPDWNGVTSFSYGARAGDGECIGDAEAFATVTITVNPVNDAPTARADSFQALRDRTLNVAGPGILLNDSDVDGDAISAFKESDPAHGSVMLAPDGSFIFTPDAGYVGPDGFSYRASDGTMTSPVRIVSITVTAIPTPAPTIAPTAAPTVDATPTEAPSPTASAEAPASADPFESAPASAVPSASASAATPSPSIIPAPVDVDGGLSIPALVAGLLLLSLLAFGGAYLLPKWLERRRAAGSIDGGPRQGS
jgi:hypothetical protein